MRRLLSVLALLVGAVLSMATTTEAPQTYTGVDAQGPDAVLHNGESIEHLITIAITPGVDLDAWSASAQLRLSVLAAGLGGESSIRFGVEDDVTEELLDAGVVRELVMSVEVPLDCVVTGADDMRRARGVVPIECVVTVPFTLSSVHPDRTAPVLVDWEAELDVSVFGTYPDLRADIQID